MVFAAAVRFATMDERVRAVVALYAAPKSYEPYISKTDPRPGMIDYVSQAKIPLQFHYGTKDEIIPMSDVEKFKQVLQREKLNTEIYI